MKVPLLDLTRQYEMLKDRIEPKILEVAQSGKYIMGPYVKEFEEKAAKYIGVKHAIGVASGTDALLLSLEAFGVKAGDEVITTPFSFFATSEVIANLGAKPVFVDVDPDTMNIDPELIEAKITEKTKAIIPVHIFGASADMDPIMKIAEKHDLKVCEDACQAIGTEYKGNKTGTLGHTGGFSFFPSKNLGAFGDGGLVTTNDDELAELIGVLQKHGSFIRYQNDILGHNSRLDGMQAAILNIKLDHLDDWNNARRANAAYYREVFDATDGLIVVQDEADYTRHTYHQFTVKIENGKRDLIHEKLKELGIGNAIYYTIPLHLQKAHDDLGYKTGDMPVTEDLCSKVISLPIFPELREDEREHVAKTVVEIARS